MSQLEKTSLRLLNAMLSRLVKRGSLVLIDAAGDRHDHGDGGEPKAVIRLHDAALYRGLFTNPELVAGEAYMDGTLTYEEGSIRDLLKVFHMNAQNLRGRPMRRALAGGLKKVRRFQQHNPVIKARENVAHHYDLSNDFYRLFLDEDLNYSCAYFEDDAQSLEGAQRAKQRHIAAKLRIEPGMRVLDIGCGWGGMGLYLAEHLGAEVVGVTLSKEQQALANERAREKGLKDKVDFRLIDYRHVQEKFDRVVSIGMFEHVGVPHYREFFYKVQDVLEDDGLALLHAIGHRGPPNTTGPWIRKYIFPGGYSPSLSETFAEIEQTDLWVTDTEILRLHYAATLQEWHRRFQENRETVAEMFDERFCRMWEFYLSTSEFAFRHGGHYVFQIQLAKEVGAAPIKRDYMRKEEKRLRHSGA
ncbi:MAG: cyclopropane-fatty-acyl-phospholipid synthase family protein [Pseudomonadota bacterium]